MTESRALTSRTCSRRPIGTSAGYAPEGVLIVCLLLLMLLFSITALVSRLYHKKIHGLADQWFAQGEATFKAGNPSAALIDYRNALVYSPENSIFQFHLARALSAAGRYEEARSYFVNLLAEAPGRGDVNLELARIAAHENSPNAALLYYHSAIYGTWETDPLEMRWRVRRELCEYLLNRSDLAGAQPELIALAQDIPAGNTEAFLEAGNLLLRAALWTRALADFRQIPKTDKQRHAALVGMAKADFELHRYAQTLDYLDRLPPDQREQPAIATILQRSREIEAVNPFSPGLSASERAKRTVAALMQADTRISQCAHDKGQPLSANTATTDLQKLYSSRKQMTIHQTELNLTRHPDQIEGAMTLVFQMEDAADRECGPPIDDADQILELIARSRSGVPNNE